ncbi:MAG: PqqD family protein [Clostridia bacterium]|nr:PqqD family protein [Clostridia bacterium]
MKIKSGFVVREVAGQTIVVALGEATKIFNGMIRLNETGRIIWDMLSVGSEKADIVRRITEEYDIDEKTVQADVDAFINTLQGANILE